MLGVVVQEQPQVEQKWFPHPAGAEGQPLATNENPVWPPGVVGIGRARALLTSPRRVYKSKEAWKESEQYESNSVHEHVLAALSLQILFLFKI
uniref:Uncharacterized protein n=1 Tax=Xenopus tropicalis TaxID=8364 RepID=A0A1B8XU55_XENTR